MVPWWCIAYTVSYPVLASSIFRSQLTDCLPLIYVFVPDYLFDPVSAGTVLELLTACNASVPLSVVLDAFLLGVIRTTIGTVFLPIFSAS